MLLSVLLAYLNRLPESLGKRRPRRAGPTRPSRAGTRPTLEVLEDRLALSGYTFTTIDGPPNAIPGSASTNGINDPGQIVGTYSDANGVAHAYLLSAIALANTSGGDEPGPTADRPRE
jgi:hypothetical protein